MAALRALAARASSGACAVDVEWAPAPGAVEDVAWSPTEATVLMTCGSAAGALRVLDARTASRAMLTRADAHGAADVNALSWNRSVAYLVATAGDDGCARVWDLRRFGAAAQRGHPAAQFGVAVALGSDAFVVGDDAERAALRAYAAEVGGAAAAAAAAALGRASREDAAVLHLYFAAAGGDPLANMALGARHVHGDGVPKDCDAALRFYERAADEAVRRAAAEGVLRPNARERLSAAGGRVAALEALWDATAGRLLDLGAGLVEHRDA